MSIIKLIAFDMDGTLYTTEDIADVVFNSAVEKFNNLYKQNIVCPGKKEIIMQLGNPIDIIFRNLFPNLDDNYRKILSKIEIEILLDFVKQKKGKLMPYVEEVIPELSKKYRLVIASNGRIEYLKTVLETYNLDKYFDDIIVIDNKNIINKSDIIKAYLKKYNINFVEMLLVGDRKSDFDAARENSIWFIGYINGFYSEEEINYENYKIESLLEIKEIINLIENKIMYL